MNGKRPAMNPRLLQHASLCLILGSFPGFSRFAAAQNPRTWEIVPSPTNVSLSSLSYGNGYWLALSNLFGPGGISQPLTIPRSADGLNWQRLENVSGLDFPPEVFQFQFRFLNGRFLISSFISPESTIWKQSADGQTWTDFPVPTGYRVNDITYADGVWVCVGFPGLFARAAVPGNWTPDGSSLTSSSVDQVIHFGGHFHAFTRGSGLQAFSSPDGITWTIQQNSPGVSFDRPEFGEIELPNGTVESVVVGTSNTSSCYIGRASGARVIWETRSRPTYGKLIYRRSADAGRPGFSRREWVTLYSSSDPGPAVYTLAAPGETPVTEDRATFNSFISMAAGPDAMIAVGNGGVIRRYPTGLPAPAAPLDLTIRPAVELKWKSKAGASYQIEESTDNLLWQLAIPSSLPGNGLDMKWTAPQAGAKRFYRVRES